MTCNVKPMPKQLSQDETRALLQDKGLRVTGPRLAVLRVLAAAEHPSSYSEVLESLGETSWDSSTTYRTLKKLADEKLAVIASRADGIDRYIFADGEEHDHAHAHFVCNDCGEVSCLPESLEAQFAPDDRWAASVKSAQIQLRGECPECIE